MAKPCTKGTSGTFGSSKSDVNKAIKTTLHDAPGDFFYLNNGVTAVCDLIEPKATKNGAKKFKVRGLSIINGADRGVGRRIRAPVSGEEHRRRQGDAYPDQGTCGRAIRQAGDQSRNHQNPVQTANFASLDEKQERLRQEMPPEIRYHYRPEALATGPRRSRWMRR
jgi:hypothetical protein